MVNPATLSVLIRVEVWTFSNRQWPSNINRIIGNTVAILITVAVYPAGVKKVPFLFVVGC